MHINDPFFKQDSIHKYHWRPLDTVSIYLSSWGALYKTREPMGRVSNHARTVGSLCSFLFCPSVHLSNDHVGTGEAATAKDPRHVLL